VPALTLRDVFGSNIQELMKRYFKALSVENLTVESLDDIEASLELGESTKSDNEGLIGNLKGTLFEVIVALAYRATGSDVTLQKRIRRLDEDEEYEVDVVASTGDTKCTLVEAKGRHSAYLEAKDEVERQFELRCRAAADEYG